MIADINTLDLTQLRIPESQHPAFYNFSAGELFMEYKGAECQMPAIKTASNKMIRRCVLDWVRILRKATKRLKGQQRAMHRNSELTKLIQQQEKDQRNYKVWH